MIKHMSPQKKYTVVESNEKGPYHSLSPLDNDTAVKYVRMLFIMQICRERDDLVNEYCQHNKDILILQEGKDTFYDILCLNNLIDAFITFCLKDDRITTPDYKSAEIKTDSGFYRISVVDCEEIV
jgi:hypothetical protein